VPRARTRLTRRARSTYRDHVHAISKGSDPREVMAELYGKKTGLCRGQGGSMHMFDSKNGLLGGYAFIGEGIPVGLGAAFQSKYRVDVLGEEGPYAVTASFFGDGTCNVGQFYECLNMAALYKLPHIFVVENNKWAIGMSHARSTASTAGDEYPYIYKKGPAFGMPSVYVDGMDVVKVSRAGGQGLASSKGWRVPRVGAGEAGVKARVPQSREGDWRGGRRSRGGRAGCAKWRNPSHEARAAMPTPRLLALRRACTPRSACSRMTTSRLFSCAPTSLTPAPATRLSRL